ncbi:MAG TPA: dipeptide epimerase [Saprospiraceae bacterium]|nr:dipeptide epimerase [Saprospiraceae bacterium]
MKIVSSECWLEHFALKESYSIAYEDNISHCDNVFLTLQTDDGFIGHGMAAPDEVVTGENAQSVLKAYSSHIADCMKGENPFYYSRLYEELREALPGQSSALAMVEIALYDIMSQKAEVPLYMFLGGFRQRIITSVTIGIMEDDLVMERMDKLIQQGIRSIKLKGGRDVDRDIRIVEKVRKKTGKNIALTFDANQGYSLIEAAHFIRNIRHVDLELIEQPTSPELTNQWHLLRQEGNIPIMADESLKKLSDSFTLTSRQSVDFLNIKLMKVGGITPALQINNSARSANVRCMMGCMDESSLGVAAGLHVALARPNISHADLDSWLDVENDPFAGLVILQDGYLTPTDLPGLGIPKSFRSGMGR